MEVESYKPYKSRSILTHTHWLFRNEECHGRGKATDALELLDRLIDDCADVRELAAEDEMNAAVAREIHDLRTERGLPPKDLAARLVLE